MAERLRVIERSDGGRPVTALDLNDGTNLAIKINSIVHQPGDRGAQLSREPSRYGGQRVVGERVENGTLSWDARLTGSSTDNLNQQIENLLSTIEAASINRLIEWRRDGATFSSYFRVAGPGTWTETYTQETAAANLTFVHLQFPVRPLVEWDQMTIADDFSVDSLSDYTFDAATSADVAVSSGVLAPVVGAALTAERRARHTVRGYPLLEGQATIKATPGSTLSSFKAGVILRGSAPTTYVEVYVDDNGTNSRLRIDVVIAGTRTNRQTTNLAARISNGTAFWVRGRIVGQTVAAEYWTSQPQFAASNATLNPAAYTLAAGEQTSLIAGHAGWSWVPQQSAAALDDFRLRPFYRYRGSLTTPAVIRYPDAIPGTAPALADVLIANTSVPTTRQFGLIGWAQQSASTPNVAAVLDSSAATVGTTSLTEGAQAGAYGGSDARITAAGAVNTTLGWVVACPLTAADDFADDTVDVEVWARLVLSSTLVNPRANAAVVVNGINPRATYSLDFGSTGRALTVPSSGTVYRFTRLGVLTLPTDASSLSVFVGVLCDAGSTGPIGIDYAELVPARRRAASPSGVPSAGYPGFVVASVAGVKVVHSDLSGALGVDPLNPFSPAPDTGLGGSLIQPPAGLVDLLVELHEQIPDDPTSSTASDSIGHAVTVALDVTPRSYLLRSA